MDRAIWELLEPYVVVSLRIAPIVAIATPFMGDQMPVRTRVALLVILTAVVAPAAAGWSRAAVDEGSWIALAVHEVVAGTTLAFLLKTYFAFAGSVGAFLDLGRGATSSQIFDPLTRSQSSPLETLVSYAVLLAFVAAGGLREVIAALVESYRVAPLGGVGLLGSGSSMSTLVDLVAGMFTASIGMAAPVLAAMFLLDAALAFVNRASAQIQVFSLGFVMKPVLGISLFLGLYGLLVDGAAERLSDLLAVWVAR